MLWSEMSWDIQKENFELSVNMIATAVSQINKIWYKTNFPSLQHIKKLAWSVGICYIFAHQI